MKAYLCHGLFIYILHEGLFIYILHEGLFMSCLIRKNLQLCTSVHFFDANLSWGEGHFYLPPVAVPLITQNWLKL